MKKVCAIILIWVLISSFAVADGLDILAQLSFDELVQLKNVIDCEYFSRPEAEPLKLAPGFYTVGIDMLPGKYYVTLGGITTEDNNARIHIYENQEVYDARPEGKYGDYIFDDYIYAQDTPQSIMLDDGNYIYIQRNSLLFKTSEFTDEEMFKYEAPDGNVIPAGVYIVGTDGDFPIGSYTAYCSGNSKGRAYIYYSLEKFQSDGTKYRTADTHILVDVGESAPIYLTDGSVVVVDTELVMTKQKALGFKW